MRQITKEEFFDKRGEQRVGKQRGEASRLFLSMKKGQAFLIPKSEWTYKARPSGVATYLKKIGEGVWLTATRPDGIYVLRKE